MKELLLQYAAYNVWANRLLLETILKLPEDKLHEKVPSSFDTLHSTIRHLLYAENIWWQRFRLHEKNTSATVPGNTETTRETGNALLQQGKLWEQWIQATDESSLLHIFVYRNSKGEEFKQPFYQVLLHLFNHDTYHRGQLVTILRNLGETAIPATDFILWSRVK
jgi:uncharacterized damage-inducible protein DinB